MTNRLPISCYIVAHNEGDRIGITIGSVRDWVDEVIVVDSGSTDNTVAVCEALGARVIYNKWPGYGFQKRFAEDQCKHYWVLNLDADEEITPALRDEIIALFAADEPQMAGYILKIRDLLPGETKLAPFTHTDLRTRLYNLRKARVQAIASYDPVEIKEGKTATLNAPALHRSFRSLAHMLEKINAYTSVQANDLLKKGVTLPQVRLVTELPVAFFKCYFLRAYCLRGWRGFIYSMVFAYGRFIRIAKYIELSRNR